MDLTTTGDILRVRSWDDFRGQATLKSRLEVNIQSALSRRQMLDHVFLAAPPGYGKTSLASIIASRLGDEFMSLKMPIRKKDFVHSTIQWQGGVLLLDEIHAAPRAFQEFLLPAIEDGYIQLDTGETLSTSHITIIAATTEPGSVIKPLRERFLIVPRFTDYADEEMGEILRGMMSHVGVDLDTETTTKLGLAAAGTPRIAGALTLAARDLSISNLPVTLESILAQTGMDPDGLSEQQIEYLHTLHELQGTAGLRNICSLLQIPIGDIEELERLLVRRGFIRLNPSGRTLTAAGHRKCKIGVTSPRTLQGAHLD